MINNKLSSFFPHKKIKKELPKISEKSIPTHFIAINRSYEGDINEITLP